MKNIKALSIALWALAISFACSSCCNCPNKIPQEYMPILAWYSIPAEDATLERYQELAECGFNINFSHLQKTEDMLKALDLCEQTGIKLMATCGDLQHKTDSTVKLIKDHPALYGYFLQDEPSPASFPMLREWADKIKAADGGEHPLYLNLFPNYVDTSVLGCSYHEYATRFIDEVQLPLVSFDFYPITTEGIRQMWYDNLQVIADESEKANLPFWAFALSTAHDPYPIPTMASLRIQMYTNLAYGAQGLQYFTYWNPGTTTWNFHEAPINQDKQRSEAYDLVKEMNKELVARSGVFMGSKVISLAHTGELPPNCKALDQLPAHVTALDCPDGAVVSVLEKEDFHYLVVVSRTMDKPIALKVGFDEKACLIDREGKAVKLGRGESDIMIEEGDVAIFRYKK